MARAEAETALPRARLESELVRTCRQLALFAPFLPFVTDEVWSWWQSGSVHNAKWPNFADVRRFASDTDLNITEAVAQVLSMIRKAKSDAQVSMKNEIVHATITAPAAVIEAAKQAEKDLLTAGRVQAATWVEGAEVSVNADLAPASN